MLRYLHLPVEGRREIAHSTIVFTPFNLNTRWLRFRGAARVSNIPFYASLCWCVCGRESKTRKIAREGCGKHFSRSTFSFIQFKSWGGFGRPAQKAEKIAYCTFRAQKVFELQFEHPAEYDSVEVWVLPGVGCVKKQWKRVYGLNPSSEKFTVKISWLFFFLQMDSHKHTEQGPFRGMNQ